MLGVARPPTPSSSSRSPPNVQRQAQKRSGRELLGHARPHHGNSTRAGGSRCPLHSFLLFMVSLLFQYYYLLCNALPMGDDDDDDDDDDG